jgi:general secretion pathway protein K
MTPNRRSQRGYMLLIVLWTVGLLALAGSRLLVTARQESTVAGNARDSARLKAAADGAVQRVIFARLTPGGGRWNPEDAQSEIRIGPVPVIVRLEDETDKINPNLASPALLRALLIEVGADPGTAAAVTAGIIEWREGAAANDRAAIQRYAAAGRDYAPPGAPLVTLDELGAILGMTPDLLARLRPHMSVISDRDPGPATRDPIVARALAAAGEAAGLSVEVEPTLISIYADARGAGRTHFAIRVVLETNPQAQGRRYRILSYERFWDGP